MKTLLIAIPSYTGKVPLELMMELFHQEQVKDLNLRFTYTKRVPIEKARNGICKFALEEGMDYVLFVDDDQIIPRETIKKLVELDKDIVCTPILDRNGEGRIALFNKDWDDILDCTEDMEVGYCGMGCTLIKIDVLKELYSKYERPFEFGYIGEDDDQRYLGEDLMFTKRARENGFNIWCKHDIKPIHLGDERKFQYSPLKNMFNSK
uniref:Putative glycosyl transferase n=1 Tax=viral metagenome TaxID=1070528 RepID=A0A6H1ZVL4_9ZZZZ